MFSILGASYSGVSSSQIALILVSLGLVLFLGLEVEVLEVVVQSYESVLGLEVSYFFVGEVIGRLVSRSLTEVEAVSVLSSAS